MSRHRSRQHENEPPGNGLNDELFWDANDRKTRQTRHREYSRPRSLDRDWLSFDISLGPATLSQPSGRHGQAEHVVLLRKSPGKVTEFQISAAIYRTGDDDAKVDLHLMEASNEWNGMRWYHVQQNELQLEPLIDMVDSKPGLDASDRLLAAGLLREVHAECSWKQRTSRLPPGFIRRHCGKTAHRAKDRPDNAVVFMSVPFFSNEIRPTAFSSSQSPTTTLLQAGYPDDNTPASSSAAARSASKTPPGVPELCVSHLWLLLCNKVLFTVSDRDAEHHMHELFTTTSISPSGSKPLLAEITTPRQRTYHMIIDPLPSYFHFREQVRQKCLNYPGVDVNTYFLTFNDHTELNASSWIDRMRSEKNAVVQIRVCSDGRIASPRGEGLKASPWYDDRQVLLMQPRDILEDRSHHPAVSAKRELEGLVNEHFQRSDKQGIYELLELGNVELRGPPKVIDNTITGHAKHPMPEVYDISAPRLPLMLENGPSVFSRLKPYNADQDQEPLSSDAGSDTAEAGPVVQEFSADDFTSMGAADDTGAVGVLADPSHDADGPAASASNHSFEPSDALVVRGSDNSYSNVGKSVPRPRDDVRDGDEHEPRVSTAGSEPAPDTLEYLHSISPTSLRIVNPQTVPDIDQRTSLSPGHAARNDRLSGDETTSPRPGFPEHRSLQNILGSREGLGKHEQATATGPRFARAPNVAPFFKWAAKGYPEEGLPREETIDQTRTLNTILDGLSFVRDVKSRKPFVRCPEFTLSVLESDFPFLRDSNEIARRDGSAFAAEHEALKLRVGRSLVEQGLCERDDLTFHIGAIYDETANIVGKYIEAGHPHSVLLKLWGSLHSVFHMLIDSDEALHDNELSVFSVRPLDECKRRIHEHMIAYSWVDDSHQCCLGRIFHTKFELIAHLRSTHLSWRLSPSDSQVELLIAEHGRGRTLELLGITNSFLGFLYQFREQVEGIACGVASTSEGVSGFALSLPSSLVASFGQFVVAHAECAFAASRYDRLYRIAWTAKQHKRTRESARRSIDTATEGCQRALDLVHKARRDVSLVCNADARLLSLVEVNSVGLPLIAAGLLANASSKVTISGEDRNIVQMHQDLSKTLELQAYEKPSRKLLLRLNRFRQELIALSESRAKADEGNFHFARCIRPSSFRITTQDRKSQFRSEHKLLSDHHFDLVFQTSQVDRLLHKNSDLSSQVKQSVEVLEADHGKAILTFTTITTIFLPLSFVSTFFGMNTTDVRNMDGSQWVFWAAAIPFTALVTGLTLLFAYRWNAIVDRSQASWASMKLKIQQFDIKDKDTWRAGRLPIWSTETEDKRARMRTDTWGTMESGRAARRAR
ncbi:unnamed protein product [Zymoseptoria tritici ST99CH_1A5]|uniref:Uncharacterized protein n=1 Tax=Zymoseptoria tritici ST99CH_1A5 TaxID=1276529 RepID=A0A1Y6M1A5_ZYMTR|nr:unnamed protein product [Zymoseptoria tritici ST99CH_1A5]